MWHLKTTTMPVIVRVLCMIKKGTEKPINIWYLAVAAYKKYLKNALCGTAHLFRRVLSKWLKR